MAVQIAHPERHSNALKRKRLAAWPENASAILEASRSKRNIGSNCNVAIRYVFGDPVVGCIRSFRNSDVANKRIGAGAYPAIADDMDVKAMAGGNALHLGFDRAGIAIDVNLRHIAGIGLRRGHIRASGFFVELLRRTMARIQITPNLAIDEREIEEQFVQASGPGGQNVNKVATAVQIRFDIEHSPSLDDYIRARLMRLAGRRVNKDGILVIIARRFRTQERNRADARQRLIELIKRSSAPQKPRKKTRPSKAVKRRRLDDKTARSRLKRMRATPEDE